MDDILIHSDSKSDHDKKVRQVLNRPSEAGVTLNSKCQFSQASIIFLGHIIDSSRIKADPEKTHATCTCNFPIPGNVTDVQRFNGMVNQLGKFIPGLAEINLPLRQLLRKNQSWLWGPAQEEAFQRIEDALLRTIHSCTL